MKTFLICSLLIPALAQAEDATIRDIYPDTWVATDALGRQMPAYEEVGPVKTDQRRVVGIFYITWHGDGLANMKSPYSADVTKILQTDPAARLDGKHPLWTEGMYHWGEPEAGYFLSKDEWVIRRDISMLSDAGVDVLVMDVTNAVRYWDEWDVLFPTMLKMKAEGNKVPQFCFWAFNGPVITVVQDLYDKIYKAEKYKELWFYWDGKPLLLYNANPGWDSNGNTGNHPNPHYDPASKTDPNHPHYGDPDYAEEFYKDYTKEVKDFFTLRNMWWGYWEWAGKRYIGMEDNWSFGYDLGDERVKTMAPDDLLSRHNGAKEEAAVTPAQHPVSLTGKCWTRENGEPELDEHDMPKPTLVPWLGKTVDHPEGYGIYFQQRWAEAIAAAPQFLYINDWNEWTAGKYHPQEGQTFDFMRRQASYRFIDQYNAEFNRAIQPMKDGYTDNYYMQMAQNIRRYKGVRPMPRIKGLQPVTVDGDFADWAKVEVEYRDTAGDTARRDYAGYGGLHYKNDSGRNDIVTSKVAVDKDNIYFYVETREPLTPHTDPNWMLLLVDADCNSQTGWNGYDYLINKKVIDEKTTTLMRFDKEKADWVEVAQLPLACAGKSLELAAPRNQLVCDDTIVIQGPVAAEAFAADSLRFDFHWCDNPAELKDPISFCVNGDSAPNRRFNYRCIWNAER